jgi:DNA helicase-2/ATP-dependent DNA helicase PcrA
MNPAIALNSQQIKVAHARARRTVAVAGAGTGKTAASTHWVAGLIAAGVSRSNILMVTFTRKAAEEMKSRVGRLSDHLPEPVPNGRIAIGTYHKIASMMTRKDPIGFGLTSASYSVLTDDDCGHLWKMALKAAGLPKAEGIWKKLGSIVSRMINTCVDPVKGLSEMFQFPDERDIAVGAFHHYVEMKLAANSVDYDDLLFLWLKRLQNDPEWTERVRAKWQFVLVDEFQDNNELQASIIRAMNPHYLLLVGDENQSIYGFRGADPSLMAEYINEPGAEVIPLEDNYRSGQDILDLANALVEQTSTPLVLRSGRQFKGKVEYLSFPSTNIESDRVVEWIQERRREGVKASDICVLSRSSFAFIGIEVELKARNIAYKKYGGLSLADTAEVKDFIAFLRVIFNPKDGIAWLRALTQFPKMGEAGATKFMRNSGGVPSLDGVWPDAIRPLRDWIVAAQQMPSLHDKLVYLLDRVKPLIEVNYKENAAERIATLGALVASTKDKDFSMASFLDAFSTEKFDDGKHPDGAITISTIHSAKGLEWQCVWVMGMGSMQMPHVNASTNGEKQEELRLAYVAVTRARDHLVCSYAQRLNTGQGQSPCPFLPETVEWDESSVGSYETTRTSGDQSRKSYAATAGQ